MQGYKMSWFLQFGITDHYSTAGPAANSALHSKHCDSKPATQQGQGLRVGRRRRRRTKAGVFHLNSRSASLVTMASSSSPTLLLLVLGLVVVLLPAAIAAASASARAVPVSFPELPLSTSSRWVVGADGRRVKLVCANWASHLEPAAAEGLSRRAVGEIAARVAAMGFNCVRLTWPTYLAINATLSSLPLRWSLERLGMRESVAGVRVNNPGLLDLPLIDVFREVVSALARNSVMVILDNQMTTPGWCCSRSDGNGFFGDKYFDPEEWLKGLSAMATMFRHTQNVVGMSLRNELRGPYQNASLWYRYMQQGAEAVHAANPNVLVILSGLDFDNSLSFLLSKQVELSFTGKLVFEQHWYGFSDGTNWEHWNQNDACGVAVDSIRTKGLFLLQQGWPLFFSEIGFDMSGSHIADNRYLTCFLSVAAEMDLDWAIWALQGSYYIREGILAYDESYGLLSWDWCTARNPSFIKRIDSLQSPFQGPGLTNSHEPYNVIFHPQTGLCVLVKSSNSLQLGPCDESNAWNYTSTNKLVLKHTGQCLEAMSVGNIAKLGSDCSKSCSRWQLISNSSMHVSTELAKTGTRVCLDVSHGVITTNECKCLSKDPTCDPESQWFKIILSSKGIPAEASILQLPSLGPWPPTSSSSW